MILYHALEEEKTRQCVFDLTADGAGYENHGGFPLGSHDWSIYWHCVMVDSCFGSHSKVLF